MDTSPNRQRAVDESKSVKEKLREEETSYSQLLTECRMQRALQLIVIHGFQLSELQYPVDITACRISFTSFEIIMG